MHVVHDGVSIALDLGICHGEQRTGAVQERHTGAERHQCVHVRRSVPQAFEAADEKLLVDDHDRSRQEQLNQSHCHMVSL